MFKTGQYNARGRHQFQLNSIYQDALMDAQKHPEAHRDLIVRACG
ncbi:MAG: hypothetical protein LBQ48_05395 [Oscillospiraceae bacterium]|nr:hypothetical protein [Oscillospiraceae bacterium]